MTRRRVIKPPKHIVVHLMSNQTDRSDFDDMVGELVGYAGDIRMICSLEDIEKVREVLSPKNNGWPSLKLVESDEPGAILFQYQEIPEEGERDGQ